MTRMTNALRDAIVTAALDKCGYAKAQDNLDKRRDAWSEAVRLDALGTSETELLAAEAQAKKIFSKVPEGLKSREATLLRQSNLVLIVAGQRDTVYFAGDEEKISPYRHTLDAAHPLAVEREAILNEVNRLDTWRADVREPVRAAVYAVTTVAALLKAWPESKELIPATVPEAKSQLPALQVADLNALVGLPSE